MKLRMLILIACLEIISNASRASISDKKASDPHQQFFSDQQFNKFRDRGLVSNIRQDLINDQTLSRSSKSIQIIVVGKEITLKGPVPSVNEKNRILEIAQKNSAGHNIRNQLDVIRE